MPKVHLVKKARKEIPHAGVKVGDSYYWWKFRYGGKRISKTYPKPSQLTQSDFLISLYDIQERYGHLESCTSYQDLSDEVESIKAEIEELRDEQEEKRNNMPEHLQDVGTGELLQERYDALDEWYNEIDGVDLDFDEDGEQTEEEWLQEKIDELTNISCNI